VRAYQFIVEYRRDKTAQALGDKLINALNKSQPSNLPGDLYNINSFLRMISNPERYYSKEILFNMLGKLHRLDPSKSEEMNKLFVSLKPQIIERILEELEKHDPTQNKQYTQWIARAWANAGGNGKLEDFNRMDYINLYHQAKAKHLVPPEFSDINRFKTYHEFENWFHRSGIPDKMYAQEEEEKLSKGTGDKIYEDAYVMVIIPLDEAGACRYGKGTRWCTASTQGVNYFDRYNREGPLYILIPKKPKYEGEKYQLHFPSGQYMNEEDEQQNLVFLLKRRFPQLIPLFLDREGDRFKDTIDFASDEELSAFSKFIGEGVADIGYHLFNEIEQGDDYYYDWVSEEAKKRGYVDENGDIDWDKVHDDEDLQYTRYNDEARKLLKTIESLKDLSPSTIRNSLNEIKDLVNYDNDFHLLELLYPAIVKEHGYSNYDEDFSGQIYKSLFVRKKRDLKYKTNLKEIGNVGNWVVAVDKYFINEN
jgi:hypothetical protein